MVEFLYSESEATSSLTASLLSQSQIMTRTSDLGGFDKDPDGISIDRDDPDRDWEKETCLAQEHSTVRSPEAVHGGVKMWVPLMKVESTKTGLISNSSPFQWDCSEQCRSRSSRRWMRDWAADRFLMTHQPAVILISTTWKICHNLFSFEWNH